MMPPTERHLSPFIYAVYADATFSLFTRHVIYMPPDAYLHFRWRLFAYYCLILFLFCRLLITPPLTCCFFFFFFFLYFMPFFHIIATLHAPSFDYYFLIINYLMPDAVDYYFIITDYYYYYFSVHSTRRHFISMSMLIIIRHYCPLSPRLRYSFILFIYADAIMPLMMRRNIFFESPFDCFDDA